MSSFSPNEWITLLLSITALIISVVLTISQILLARTANRLPIGIDFLREFRSKDFKKDFKLAKDILTETKSYSSLSEEDKYTINSVAHFYDNLGLLIYSETIKKSFILPFLGQNVITSWNIFRDYILEQRKERSNPNYQSYFEYLAKISTKDSDGDIRKKLGLQ